MYQVREKQKANQLAICHCGDGKERKLAEGGSTLDVVGECDDCGGEGAGVCCAICKQISGNPDEEFEFHHWEYEENIGVFLCPSCHEHVHSTEQSYPNSDSEWRYHTLSNALEKYREHNDITSKTEAKIESELNLPPEIRGRSEE